ATLLILHRRVVDEHRRAARLRRRVAALGTGHHFVAQPNVRERAAHHDLMIAAASAIGIEILSLNAVSDQPFTGRTRDGNVAGGRDVVGRDRVAEQTECARASNRANARRLRAHVVEIRRILDIGGALIPCEGLSARHLELLPELVAAENVGVLRLEELAFYAAIDLVLHLLRRRPDVAKEDWPVAADA